MKGKIHFLILLSLILLFYNVQFGYTENAGPGVTPAAGESVENKTSVTAEPAPSITPQAAHRRPRRRLHRKPGNTNPGSDNLKASILRPLKRRYSRLFRLYHKQCRRLCRKGL